MNRCKTLERNSSINNFINNCIMINDFLFQYFYELLNLFSNVEIYKWIRVMNWHVYVCHQNICMILVIRYMYPLPLLKKWNRQMCRIWKKNNSKTKLRKIGASLCTHFLSNRMQMLAFSPTIVSAFCSISWFVNISKKQSSDLSL